MTGKQSWYLCFLSYTEAKAHDILGACRLLVQPWSLAGCLAMSCTCEAFYQSCSGPLLNPRRHCLLNQPQQCHWTPCKQFFWSCYLKRWRTAAHDNNSCKRSSEYLLATGMSS